MLNLIPQPLRAESTKGLVWFSKKTTFSGAFSGIYPVLRPMLPLCEEAQENTLLFQKDSSLPEESYRLHCENGDLFVEASDQRGAFYAVMTLLQLCGEGASFESVSIEDAPRYHHRGFMLDCARHFWSVKKIKQILDIMARLKMNVFHWHLTDDQGWRIEIKKYPLLTEKGAIRKSTALSLTGYEEHKEPRDYTEYGRGLFYTQEEVRDVVAYAKARQIDILPEIDMPGHFVAAIACYPHLSCTGEPTEVSDRWGVLDNIGCCGKEDIYNFVKDIIDELCELFPYPYFHIGGDEVPKTRWKQCPACQAKIKELGLKDENALQGHFNNVITAYLREKGRSTVGWNEILEASDALDPTIIPQWWTPMEGSHRELDWLAAGNHLIISLIDYVYMTHAYAIRPLAKTYSFGPDKLGITDDTNVLGVEAPQWTEYIRDEEKLDINTFPRLSAIAEVAWTQPENKDYDSFEQRLENLRGYYAKLGVKLPPAWLYRGDSIAPVDEKDRIEKGWAVWKNDPYFEIKMLHEKEG